MTSPTQLTLAKLRADGWTPWVVEYWNSFVHQRRDLYGIVDVIGVRGTETIAVQTTSASNVAARITKMRASEYLPRLIAAGWRIEIHGWGKHPVKRGAKAMRWRCRVVDMAHPTEGYPNVTQPDSCPMEDAKVPTQGACALTLAADSHGHTRAATHHESPNPSGFLPLTQPLPGGLPSACRPARAMTGNPFPPPRGTEDVNSPLPTV